MVGMMAVVSVVKVSANHCRLRPLNIAQILTLSLGLALVLFRSDVLFRCDIRH